MTAARWAGFLRELGHLVVVLPEWSGEDGDVLIALHARRSAESIARFHEARAGAPIVLALTGTDLYRDLATDHAAQRSLELASYIVVLQRRAPDALPERYRGRARVIYQSVRPPQRRDPPRDDVFEVVVLGNLRPVKDPFRCALAARLLPAVSRLRVLHVGAAIHPGMEERARREERENPRYRWLGGRPRADALAVLARARLHVLSSLMEGGANALCEAIALGVPTLASRIDGSVGILGEDYPGTFETEDTAALAELLIRAETDRSFLDDLRHRCEALRPLVDPGREREAWRSLMDEVVARGRDG